MGFRSHEVALFDANDEKVAVGMPVAEAASQVLYVWYVFVPCTQQSTSVNVTDRCVGSGKLLFFSYPRGEICVWRRCGVPPTWRSR